MKNLPEAFEPIGFTAAERDCVNALFLTGTKKGAAELTGKNLWTIDAHLKSVYEKAGVTGSLDLLAMAYRNGGFLW